MKITPCSPWHDPGISALPYSLDLSLIGNHVGPRRSAHRTIFSRRCHQTPPWSFSGNRLTGERGCMYTPRRFTNVRRMAHHGGRIVAPPEVLLSGPFNTIRCRVALATYSVRIRAAASVRERTRTGRFWLISEPNRLYRLSAVYLRLTHSSTGRHSHRRAKAATATEREHRVLFYPEKSGPLGQVRVPWLLKYL